MSTIDTKPVSKPSIELKKEDTTPIPQVEPKGAKEVASPPANKAQENATQGPSMVEKMKNILFQNVFLEYMLLVPVVIIFTYFLGGIITWTIFLAISITLSIKSIKDKKRHVYESFIESQKEDEIDDVQEVAWLNQILTKYWISCVPALVKPHIDGVSKALTDSKPPFMHKLEIGKWSFGKRGPRFSQIRTALEPDTSKYVSYKLFYYFPSTKLLFHLKKVLDGEMTFVPDFSLELRIEPIKLCVVKILLSNVVFKGRVCRFLYFLFFYS